VGLIGARIGMAAACGAMAVMAAIGTVAAMLLWPSRS
jgi:hypothetical protein